MTPGAFTTRSRPRRRSKFSIGDGSGSKANSIGKKSSAPLSVRDALSKFNILDLPILDEDENIGSLNSVDEK